MIQLRLHFDSATARDVTNALRGKLTMEEINATVEVAARTVVDRHIRETYATKPNRLGAVKTGFWERARASLVSTHDSGGVTLRIPERGVRLHYYGGVVRPSGRVSDVTGKPIRSLTIPVHKAAHGTRVKEFGDRIYWRPLAGKKGEGGLFYRRGAKPSKRDPIYYVLRKSVRIKRDPNVLPDNAAIIAACRAAVQSLVADD